MNAQGGSGEKTPSPTAGGEDGVEEGEVHVAQSLGVTEKFEARLGQVQSEIGLDTMASHSALPPKLFRRLMARHRVRHLPAPIRFKTASGTFTSKRCVRVPIKIQLQTMTKPLLTHELMVEGGNDTTTLLSFRTMINTGLLRSSAEHFYDKTKSSLQKIMN